MNIPPQFKYLKSRIFRFDNIATCFVDCTFKGNNLMKRFCSFIIISNSIILTVYGSPSNYLDIKEGFAQLDSFINQKNTADCSTAIAVCNKDLIEIQSIESFGQFEAEKQDLICSPQKPFFETNSVWLKWQINEPGLVGFTILPYNENDDLDFVLFRATSSKGLPCDNLEVVRCMRSGALLGTEDTLKSPCLGATGLSISGTEESHTTGCYSDETNFLSQIETKKDEVYYLLINNYRSHNGFALNFEGGFSFNSEFGNCASITNASKQLDNNGFYISNIYPNPTSDKLVIDLETDLSNLLNIEVISMNGISKSQDKASLKNGNNTISIVTSTLLPGSYLLKLTTSTHSEVVRFFKE